MSTPSFYATVYKLALGDYALDTGIPRLLYSATTARVLIGWKGSSVSFGNLLFYPKTDGVMLSNANYNQGDIVEDPSTQNPETVYGKVVARRPVTIGNVMVAYVYDLVQIPHLTFSPATSVLGGYDPQYYNETYYVHYYITIY